MLRGKAVKGLSPKILENRPNLVLVTPTSNPDMRPCNLCENPFKMRTRFDRFCVNCKKDSQVYQYADWMYSCAG
ncbi:MAG: hypothetical protein AB7P04_09985 [Bacteriovoracia bacterium]